MQIIGSKILDDFKKSHSIVRSSLNSWIKEVEAADWNTSQDIKDRYANASFLENNMMFFNIKGNHYRLLVKLDYQRHLVLVVWIGTHAEYTKRYC